MKSVLIFGAIKVPIVVFAFATVPTTWIRRPGLRKSILSFGSGWLARHCDAWRFGSITKLAMAVARSPTGGGPVAVIDHWSNNLADSKLIVGRKYHG
jgi:hypothetical protein